MIMVYVPAGEFSMGSESVSNAEKPVHTVYLNSYWIDQTEVTNEMFAKFVNDSGYETDAEKTGSSDVCQNGSWEQVTGADWNHPTGPSSSNSGKTNFPVIHVSWNDAKNYCAWAGRRLPTEAEWEKAASWDADKQEKRVYPWGDSIDCSLANYWGEDGWCVGDATKVGSYPWGASFYGALDMAGNVWEWVADWYSKTFYASSPSSNPLGPDSGQSRVMRGGAWYYSGYSVRSADRLWSGPTSTFTGLGFRCSRSP
jgi:formylglycine-generating enzyme required for sulfatase activity